MKKTLALVIALLFLSTSTGCSKALNNSNTNANSSNSTVKADDKKIVYDASYCEKTLRFPHISEDIKGDFVKKINKSYADFFKQYKQSITSSSVSKDTLADYTYYLDKDILCVSLKYLEPKTFSPKYINYCLNISTGQEITFEQALKLAGLSKENVKNSILQVSFAKFINESERLLENASEFKQIDPEDYQEFHLHSYQKHLEQGDLQFYLDKNKLSLFVDSFNLDKQNIKFVLPINIASTSSDVGVKNATYNQILAVNFDLKKDELASLKPKGTLQYANDSEIPQTILFTATTDNLTFSVHKASFENGINITPDKQLFTTSLNTGESVLIKDIIPEGMPNIVIIAKSKNLNLIYPISYYGISSYRELELPIAKDNHLVTKDDDIVKLSAARLMAEKYMNPDIKKSDLVISSLYIYHVLKYDIGKEPIKIKHDDATLLYSLMFADSKEAMPDFKESAWFEDGNLKIDKNTNTYLLKYAFPVQIDYKLQSTINSKPSEFFPTKSQARVKTDSIIISLSTVPELPPKKFLVKLEALNSTTIEKQTAYFKIIGIKSI